MNASYPKIAQLKTIEAFRQRLEELHLAVPADDKVLSADEQSPSQLENLVPDQVPLKYATDGDTLRISAAEK